MKARKKGKSLEMLFCDLQCRHARFPREEGVDGAKSCRTFVALYCKKKKSYVHKNLQCGEKVQKKA